MILDIIKEEIKALAEINKKHPKNIFMVKEVYDEIHKDLKVSGSQKIGKIGDVSINVISLPQPIQWKLV